MKKIKNQPLLLCLVLFLVFSSCQQDEPDPILENEDVNITSIIDNPIIYEPINLTIEINNNELGVSKIEILFNDDVVATKEGSKKLEINFNPDEYPVGGAVITVKVTDSNGHLTDHEYPISIHRLLLEISLLEDFFDDNVTAFYFFASALDGSLLASKSIDPESQDFILTTPVEIGPDTPYMLTYLERSTANSFNQTDLFTIKDLTRNNLQVLSPKIKDIRISGSRNEYSTNGFSDSDVINIGTTIASHGYRTGYSSSNKTFILTEFGYSNINRNVTDYYVPVQALPLKDYAYIWLKKEDLSPEFILDFHELSREGIEERILDVSYSDGEGNNRYGYFTILGYRTIQDFEEGFYHNIWQRNITVDDTYPDYNSEYYFFNTSFEKYRHVLQWEDFYTKKEGAPLNTYDIPTWSFEYVHEGKEIGLTKDGDGHTIGRIVLNNMNDENVVDGNRTRYNWNIIFDSQSTDEIILPEFPEEIQSWEFVKLHNSNSLLVERVLLYDAENIASYSEYLNKVIKTDEDIVNITPNLVARFKSRRGNHWLIESDKFYN